jgi:hypothetical protein
MALPEKEVVFYLFTPFVCFACSRRAPPTWLCHKRTVAFFFLTRSGAFLALRGRRQKGRGPSAKNATSKAGVAFFYFFFFFIFLTAGLIIPNQKGFFKKKGLP